MILKHWPYILIILLLILLLLKDCGESGSQSPQNDTIRTETTHIYDTTIHHITTHKIHYAESTVMVPANTDTLQVIRDYFTSRPFSDTLLDSGLQAVYSGEIWKNSLFNPRFSYKLLKPQTSILNTVIEQKPVNKVFVGGMAGFTDKPFVGVSAALLTKREQILYLGYGTDKTAVMGLQWKIRLKRK